MFLVSCIFAFNGLLKPQDGPNMAHESPQDRPQRGPRRAQEAAMTAKTGPRDRHDGPRGRQDGPKLAPKNGFPPLMSRYWPPRSFKVPLGPLQE